MDRRLKFDVENQIAGNSVNHILQPRSTWVAARSLFICIHKLGFWWNHPSRHLSRCAQHCSVAYGSPFNQVLAQARFKIENACRQDPLRFSNSLYSRTFVWRVLYVFDVSVCLMSSEGGIHLFSRCIRCRRGIHTSPMSIIRADGTDGGVCQS